MGRKKITIAEKKEKQKQKIIHYIKQRVNEKGIKGFYALEIWDKVVPEAEFSYKNGNQNFSYKGITFSAHHPEEILAKRILAAFAMQQIFDIALPVYVPPDDDFFYGIYESFFQYEELENGTWKVVFQIRDTKITAYGATKNHAKKLIWNDAIKDILYDIDSKFTKSVCRKIFTNLVITQTDPLIKRIEFVLRNLLSKNDGKTLKSTESVLLPQEHIKLQNLLKHMRCFHLIKLNSNVERYVACVNANNIDIFVENNSVFDAKRDLIEKVMLTNRNIKTTDDNAVAAYIQKRYNTDTNTTTLDQCKRLVLHNIRTLLKINNERIQEAIWLLQKSSSFIIYCENKSLSNVISTVICCNKTFKGAGFTERIATGQAATNVFNSLFTMSLQDYMFDNSVIQFIWQSMNGQEPPKYNDDTGNIMIENALNQYFASEIKERNSKNRKELIRIIRNKDGPLIQRISFVIDCLRTNDFMLFEPTDDILTENERNFLISVDQKIQIENKSPITFTATINMNDNIISTESDKKDSARNNCIIAVYMSLETVSSKKKELTGKIVRKDEHINLFLDNQCLEEAASVLTEATKESVEKNIDKDKIVDSKNTQKLEMHEALELCRKRAQNILKERQTKLDKLTSIDLWLSSTDGKFPIHVSYFNSRFVSEIYFFDKKFSRMNISKEEAKRKLAIVVCKDLLGIELPHWNITTNKKSINESKSKDSKMIMDYSKTYFGRRAQKIISKRNGSKRTPLELWNFITKAKFLVETSKHNNDYVSTICFYGEKFTTNHSSKKEARQGVAIIALKNSFGINLNHSNESVPGEKIVNNNSVTKQKENELNSTNTYNTLVESQEKIIVPTSSQETTQTSESSKIVALQDVKEKKIEEIKAKIRASQQDSFKGTPAEFWYQVCSDINIETVIDENGETDSIINFFDESYLVSFPKRDDSENSVAAMALKSLFQVDYPHWRDYLIDNTHDLNEDTEEENQKTDETTVDEPCNNFDLPPDANFSMSELDVVSLVKISKIIEELENKAREIISTEKDISPVNLWNKTVEKHPTYLITTDFNALNRKYTATIEFHGKIFIKDNFDEMKAENGVACAALDGLLDLPFLEKEEDFENKTEKVSCVKRLKAYQKSLQCKLLCLDDVTSSDVLQKIGVDFKLKFNSTNEADDPDLIRIKEKTSQFVVEQLLELPCDDSDE